MKLGDQQVVEIDTIPTGSIGLDIAGNRRITPGRVVEIYGPESSVKQPWPSMPSQNARKKGGIAALLTPNTPLTALCRETWR